MASTVRLAVLGSTELRVDGRPVPLSPTQRRILARLALAEGRPVAAEELAGAAGTNTRSSLQATITNVRRRLVSAGGPRDIVVHAPTGYVLRGGCRTDLEELEVLATTALDAAHDGRWDDAYLPLRDVVPMLGCGPPFADLDDPDTIAIQSRWHERRLQLLAAWAEVRLRRGDHAAPLADLRALATEHPDHEGVAGLLCVSLYLEQRQEEALSIIGALRQRLLEERGQALSPELARVELAVLCQDVTMLGWRRPAAPEGVDGVLPATLDRDPRRPFVGRSTELAFLRDAVRHVVEAGAGMAVIDGDPGVGKTALVAELAAAAAADGAHVVHCWGEADVGEPYHALRLVARGLGGSGLRLADALDRTDATTRLGLAEATVRALVEASRRTSVVIVVDDLQWVDAASTAVLAHALGARGAAASPILVVATTRSDPGPGGGRLLADQARRGRLRRLRLEGLTVAEVAELASALSTGGDAHARLRLARHVHRRTGGNALLVVRLLGSGGAAAAQVSSASVDLGDLFSAELRALRDEQREVLVVAAVLGASFSVPDLATLLGVSEAGVVAALDGAARLGLVEEEAFDRYRFRHDVLRETLLSSTTQSRRARLHAAAAERLGTPPSSAVEEAARAHHLCRAVPLVPPERAVDAALAAAQRLLDVNAFEGGADLADVAVRLARSAPTAEVLVGALIVLGRAADLAGDRDVALAAFDEAFESAQRLGAAALVCDAALGEGARGLHVGEDPRAIDRLRIAARWAPDVTSRVRVLAELVPRLADAGEPAQATAVADEAVSLAATTGDQALHARGALARRHALDGTPDGRERLAASVEAARRCREAGLLDGLAVAAAFRTTDLLSVGMMREAISSGAEEDAIATSRPTPKERWFAIARRACFAQLAGRFDEADDAASAALQVGTELAFVDALPGFCVQAFATAFLRGGLCDLRPAIADVATADPGNPSWGAALALAALDGGDVDAARHHASAVASALAGAVPGRYTSAGWYVLGQALVDLEDPPSCAQVADALAPWSGQNAVVGTGVAVLGPFDRVLALLHLRLGDRDRAAVHAGAATAMAGALGSVPWAAWSTAALGLATGDPQMVATASDEAHRLGLVSLGRHIERQRSLTASARP